MHTHTHTCAVMHMCSHTQRHTCMHTTHTLTYTGKEEKENRRLRQGSVYLLCVGGVFVGAEAHSYRHWVLGHSYQVTLGTRNYSTVLSSSLSACFQHCMMVEGTEECRVERHLLCPSQEGQSKHLTQAI